MIMLKSSPPNRVAKAETQLTRLVNAMAKGAVPDVVSPHLCGARLIAANKKSGGLRPIAVGNILRRLTSKLIAKGASDRVEAILAPHQLGVGIRGGCETIIHSVREAITQNPDKWVLQLGDHALNCAWQGERIARHNSLRDVLHSTAVKAALGPTKEGQYLLPGEGGKPADIFIPRHAGGKDAALDVTVVNPLQAALVSQAADTPGHALKVAHKRKLDKSWQACNQQGIVFLPLAVESLGAWHKSAILEIQKLGSALARHTGEEEITTTRHLFQQLSIALVKGNAALMNNRNPSDGDQGDEGLGW